MPAAICFSIVVLPAFGCETIIARWPLPIGAIRSINRTDRSFSLPGTSSVYRSFGKIGTSDS